MSAEEKCAEVCKCANGVCWISTANTVTYRSIIVCDVLFK